MSYSLLRQGLQPTSLLCPWDSPGKNTGVGCHAFLHGIFPTQRSNPGLPHCRQILYHLSHQGNPRILEWVSYPFSRVSSWPRNQTRISCIAGRFFTSWATREAHYINYHIIYFHFSKHDIKSDRDELNLKKKALKHGNDHWAISVCQALYSFSTLFDCYMTPVK